MMKNDYLNSLARERAQIMRALLEQGRSLQYVAELYGISRQRVHQLVKQHFSDWKRQRRGKT